MKKRKNNISFNYILKKSILILQIRPNTSRYNHQPHLLVPNCIQRPSMDTTLTTEPSAILGELKS